MSSNGLAGGESRARPLGDMTVQREPVQVIFCFCCPQWTLWPSLGATIETDRPALGTTDFRPAGGGGSFEFTLMLKILYRKLGEGA